MSAFDQVRREAKRRVFLRNSLRALRTVAPLGNIRNIEFVAIVGGSGQDFELSQMLMNKLAEYGTVVGYSQYPRQARAGECGGDRAGA